MPRALSERGARDGHVLAASRLLGEATAEARGVATEEVIVADELPLLRAECPAAILRHETSRSSRIRISGRREARDAALLQLDLLLAA